MYTGSTLDPHLDVIKLPEGVVGAVIPASMVHPLAEELNWRLRRRDHGRK
jgi:hypothetical protein